MVSKGSGLRGKAGDGVPDGHRGEATALVGVDVLGVRALPRDGSSGGPGPSTGVALHTKVPPNCTFCDHKVRIHWLGAEYAFKSLHTLPPASDRALRFV